MKRDSKIKLNTVAIFLALVITCVFFTINFWLEDTSKNSIGSYFIKKYESHIHNRASSAILELEKGNAEPASALLSDWKDIQKLDRAYPSKRELYVSLSRYLYDKKEFEKLFKLSLSWQAVDDRDVTATAYYFESLQHLPGHQEEGRIGLKEKFKRFPGNEVLREFISRSAVDDLEAEILLRTLKPPSYGWNVFWYKGDFTILGNKLALEANNEKNDNYSISVDVPRDTVILRLDPPGGEPVRIIDIVLMVNGQVFSIASDKVNLVRMSRDGEWLVAPGDQVSFIHFNSEYIFEKITDEQVNITFRFKMNH